MKSAIGFFIFGITVCCLPFVSYGGDYRSCKAVYEIAVKSVNGKKTEMTFNLSEFFVKVWCRNALHYNEGRGKARDIAHRCMYDHWEWDPTEKADYVQSGSCGEKEIQNYPYPMNTQGVLLKDLRKTIKDRICKTFHKGKIILDLKAVTSGEKGCPKTEMLAEDYVVNCE